MTQIKDKWYRQPAMLVVAGILTMTVLGSAATLALAITHQDPLVVSDAEYQRIRDELRATVPINEGNSDG